MEFTHRCVHTHTPAQGRPLKPETLTLAQDPSWGLGGGVPPGSGHPGCQLTAAPVRAAVAAASQYPQELAPRLSLVLHSDPGWPQEPSPGALLALPAFPLSGPFEHRPHMSSPPCDTAASAAQSGSVPPGVSQTWPVWEHWSPCVTSGQAQASHISHVSPPLGTSRQSPTGALEPPGGLHLPGCSRCLLSQTHVVSANGDGPCDHVWQHFRVPCD